MLSDQQIDHYRTFGFVVLHRYLSERETADLGVEMDRAHRDAFGARFDERPDEGGMPGHYLPMMSRERTPLSLGLVEDPRFLGAARQLVGAAVLPTYAEGVLLFDQAGFHDDAGPGVKAVKFVAYLEPLIAATGALRLLPGSHHQDFSARVRAWDRRNPVEDAEHLRRQIDGLPLYVAETQPGDVIAFDWHTWHTSIRGRDRRQWRVSYVRDPATAEEVERFKDIVIDGDLALLGDEPGYDRPAYPLYDEHWLTPDPAQTERVALSSRMRELGMFQPLERT
ncbi:MAG TPA: phytanoyl-CoA dioxygenase family protein [Actinomycetes bacterium]|nr:phytanoyl-CoA dioxygenase family protein [Actinomycetes bacterium]